MSQQEVLNCLREDEWKNSAELEKEMELARPLIIRALKKLHDHNEIFRKEYKKGKGRGYQYKLK